MTYTDDRRLTRGLLLPILLALAMRPAEADASTPRQDTPIVDQGKGPASPAATLKAWANTERVAISWSIASLPEIRGVSESAGGVSRNPASVSKLITAFVALKSLGPSFQYSTSVHGRMTNGSVERLIIRGDGDPSFSSEILQIIAARLAASGLSRVDEAVVVDQSYFDDQFVPPAYDQQPGEWAAFRAPICATALDRNRISVRVLPTTVERDARAYVEPFGAALLAGRIGTVARDTKGNRIQIQVIADSERPTLRISGEVGEKEVALAFERRTDDPRKLVGYALRSAMLEHGIKVANQVELGIVADFPKLYTHQSAALAQLVHRLGKDSDNFAAEMLLKTLGARRGTLGSSSEGSRVVSELLARHGIATTDLRFVNGSGLFDANRVTTNMLVQLLAVARADPTIAPEYLAQLSIAGVDGTLAKRFRDLPAGCVIRAKSGTLRSVISLAGYVDSPDRQAFAFAVVAEDVKDQVATRQHIDRFVRSLCANPFVSGPSGS